MTATLSSLSSSLWRVVVVDDNPDDRAEARRLLLRGSDRTYQFLEVDTGAAALRAVFAPGEKPPDCVVLDYHLPDMNALEVLAALTDPTGLLACPVVVLTGSSGSEMGREVIRAGAQDYIGKGWLTAQGLTRALENATERWRLSCDLKARESALRDSESFYRQTLASIPGMVFTATPDGSWNYVSEPWVTFTGVPAVIQLGDGWLHLVHEEDRPKALAAWQEAIARQGEYDLECRVRRAEGGYEWFKIRGRAIRDARGAVARWFGTAVNVDGLKRVEEALLDRERELQTLADNSPDLLTRFDRDLKHVFVNAVVEKATGRPRHEFLGKTNRELNMPGPLCDQWDTALRRVFTTREPLSIEFAFDRVDGPHFYTARLVPEFDATGDVETVLGVVHDVSEQRRAEGALRAGEERLRLALTAARAGAWDWNCVNGTMMWSPENYELYGLDALADPPTYHEWLYHLHPDDRDRTHGAVHEALARTTPEYRVEYRVTHPQHGMRWLLGLGRIEFGPEGQPLRVIGINLDVTEQKAAEDALKDADRRKDEFLATLAHELRNPLTPLRSGLEVLKITATQEHLAAKTRDMMDRQLGHMVRLIDDLLDVSRISRGKLELKTSRVQLQVVVHHAVEASQPLVRAGGHTLSVTLPDTPLWVEGDLTRLAQVISNLLNNAAKYTPRKGRIALTVTVEQREAVVRVTDNGLGISNDMLSKVFELFSQERHNRDRAQGGLGIGLSLVQKLLDMHGGSIQAESPGLGCGSTFTARIPLREENQLMSTSKQNSVLASADGSTCRVLVVDDNTDGAEFLAMMLDLRGHQTQTAHNGPEALASARTFRPDLVFLDIGLPGMDGYEVARAFRQDPALATTVLIALTGWGSDEDKRQSHEAGFNFHLTKPVDAAAIENVLTRFAKPSPGNAPNPT